MGGRESEWGMEKERWVGWVGGGGHQQSHCTEDNRMLIHSMWERLEIWLVAALEFILSNSLMGSYHA